MKKEYLNYKDIKKPFRIWDFIILGVAILLVVVLLVVVFVPKDTPEVVSIYREGKLVKRFKLADKEVNEVVKVAGLIILVEKDGVSVVKSDCDDHCCQKTGKITRKNECIVCVPDMITVKLS